MGENIKNTRLTIRPSFHLGNTDKGKKLRFDLKKENVIFPKCFRNKILM